MLSESKESIELSSTSSSSSSSSFSTTFFFSLSKSSFFVKSSSSTFTLSSLSLPSFSSSSPSSTFSVSLPSFSSPTPLLSLSASSSFLITSPSFLSPSIFSNFNFLSLLSFAIPLSTATLLVGARTRSVSFLFVSTLSSMTTLFNRFSSSIEFTDFDIPVTIIIVYIMRVDNSKWLKECNFVYRDMIV